MDQIAKFFNETEAASYLGVSAGCMRRWRKNGVGPEHTQTGTRGFTYSSEDLDRFRQGPVFCGRRKCRPLTNTAPPVAPAESIEIAIEIGGALYAGTLYLA